MHQRGGLPGEGSQVLPTARTHCLQQLLANGRLADDVR
jgi:hypothetical protein